MSIGTKRELNQEIIEIAHILMDTMQKHAKTLDTLHVLSSFEQGNGVISTLKSENHQQNDCKVEKQVKIEDAHHVLSSFEQENGVISARKSEDHQQNDCKVGKQGKTVDFHHVLSSLEQENSVFSALKSEDHQQNDCKIEKQAKTKDAHQILPSFEQENGVLPALKSEDHQQNDRKVENRSEYCTLGPHQRQEVEILIVDDEPISMNDRESNEGDGGGLVVGPRERLKRHRKEVAGHVWIPDLWGQEDLLKDWTDCSAFDKCLMNHSIMSARASLIEEGRRANSTSLSVENSC